MRKLLFAAAVALSAPAAAIPPAPPKLLVVISIDQLSGDLWDEYRPQFTGGLARGGSGVAFRNGYQSHATSETCLGHSTILTGDRPARTGIIGNLWFDPNAPRTDKTIYCAEDERVPGSTSAKYTVSPVHLRVQTLGELLKQRVPASLSVAVAGKDRAAVMMGGHTPDQRWYWDGKQFATDLAGRAVPRSVSAVNQTLAATIAAGTPALQPPPFCAARSQVYPIPRGGKPVGGGRLERAPGDATAFRATPQFDGATLALSAALIQELGLGRDTAPDVISIGLSATDYVGHTYGTGGQEMCLQLLSLDRDLGDFFARLDGWGIDYAVALTADHGGLDIPERLTAKRVRDAAWVDLSLTPVKLGQSIAASTGLKGPIIGFGGPAGDIYIDPALGGADRAKAQAALIAAYRAHPQVAAAFTKDEIARTPMPSGDPVAWSPIQRVRASFDAERSGDLYVVLKPHIQPIADTSRYVSTHGSPWDYDRRVPILFWRPGFNPEAREGPVETVDILPTLAAMIGLPIASGSIDGKCLSAAQLAPCPAGASIPAERGKR